MKGGITRPLASYPVQYLPYVDRVNPLAINFDPLPSKRTRGADAIEATSIRIELLVRTGMD